MPALLLRRLLATAFVVLGVALLVFLLIHLIPGDPVDVMLGESASAADREALRQNLGLDRPLGAQLLAWFEGLARLDLGLSLHERQPVTRLIAERLPATLELAAAGLGVTLLLALPLGLLAAARRNTPWDRGAMVFSLLGVSIPNFWLGPLLILVFSLWLGWFPVSGREAPASVVLPALTLGLSLAAILSRMVRSSLLEVLGEDYIRTARAKGLDARRVLLGHALPNALLPVITVIGLQLGALLAGAVITETIFSWPGIGLLTIEAIQTRDYPLVQGCVLFIALAYVLINMFTDLLYGFIDPRIRLGAAR
ncbi:nickel ABC transporter permease [Thiohalobacter sp.]|uniref:nickel ABC transporter permease n=1 Tax=Thiohalobacter sp. TaxID=2025948 RepID=UPI002604049E|nr:nickel ABC transporter permease [Thiohalobacter sp.]